MWQLHHYHYGHPPEKDSNEETGTRLREARSRETVDGPSQEEKGKAVGIVVQEEGQKEDKEKD
jgi:hypothetical protein